MGLFNLFKSAKKAVDIKADEAAQAIEDQNPIGHAQDDLKAIENDLRTTEQNYAKLKATKLQFKRDIDGINDQLAVRKPQYSKAKAAVEAGDDSVADRMRKLGDRIVSLTEELEPLEVSMKDISNKMVIQEKNKEKLRKGKEEAERDLRSMKAMEQVTKSTEALNTVNTGDTTSSLAKFKERKRKMQMTLDEATVLSETLNEGDDLDDLDSESKRNDILGDL